MWSVLALCTYRQPVIHDGWRCYLWLHHDGLSVAATWAWAKFQYLHNNPRLGQTVTFLLYAPGPWRVIVTPLLELATFGLFATLGLGRWPSLRRSDDALVFATI